MTSWGFQETRRDGHRDLTGAGYTGFCSGADGSKYEREEKHGVGLLAVRAYIVAGVDKDGLLVECISARLALVRVKCLGKSTGVSFIVGYVPTEGEPTPERCYVRKALDNAIAEVPDGWRPRPCPDEFEFPYRQTRERMCGQGTRCVRT